MTIAVAALATVVFLLSFHWLRIVDVGRRIIDVSRRASTIISDPDLDDLEKEKAVQGATLDLAKGFVSIVVRSAAAVALSFVPMYLADYFDFVPTEQVIAFLSRWDVIAILSAAIILFFLLRSRLWPSR